MTAAEAAGHVRSWLDQPPVQVLASGSDQVMDTLTPLETLGAAGNLVTDAQIAAWVMDHEAVPHAADADFVRFPRLRGFNPITGVASARLQGPRRAR
jgi:hypothetical protein